MVKAEADARLHPAPACVGVRSGREQCDTGEARMTTVMAEKAVIPSPPGLPGVGHLHQIARVGLISHLLRVARDIPDGIFKLRFGSRVGLFITSADLVAEMSDETRFRKMPGPGVRVVRRFAGDGRFTAFSEEPNWGKAPRILLPAISQRAKRRN